MLEDRLSHSLINYGYKRMDSNTQGIYLFYRIEDHEITVVSINHVMAGYEPSAEQYRHILEQIKTHFLNAYSYPVRLLSILLTDEPDRVKQLTYQDDTSSDSHWIIDVRLNRLMIYEMQQAEFIEIQELIEQLLSQSDASPKDGLYHQSRSDGRAPGRYQLTPVTMGLITGNLIIFIITQFTPLFGGYYEIVEKGALSWYYVFQKQEYYRIFTSMFLHADISHLFNNMLVLLFVGGNLERIIGKWKYLFIYLGTGMIAGITSIGYNMWKEYASTAYWETTSSIGASGAIFGIVGAVLFLVIFHRGRIKEISTSQMIIFVILSLYNGIVNSHIDQAAHLGGFLGGFLFSLVLLRRQERLNNTSI